MTDEPEAAPESTDLKAELVEKIRRAGGIADMRYSIRTLEDMLANINLEVPLPQADSDRDAELDALRAQRAASKAATAFRPLAPVETPPKPPMVPEAVACRVTKAGHLQIHTGKEAPDHLFRWGEVIHLPPDVAQSLEARNFVEIGEPE